MSNSRFNLALGLLLTGVLVAVGQPSPLAEQQEAKLIAILKSDAPRKAKADACRELSTIATAASVPVLADLLSDPELNHMARYALETIPDPAVDNALRTALGKLNGRPLVGVIGSLGVRRDAQAVPPLSGLLRNTDPDVAQAAARALGSIGNSAAAKALSEALADVSAANQVAFCEGLFRCAESLAAKGEHQPAMALYDRLRGLSAAPQQVRAGALRGAVLTRGNDGIPLLREAIRSDDYVLVAAAALTAMEMPGASVTQALVDELGRHSADKQILLLKTLGRRGDVGALPAVMALARDGAKAVRLAAIRVLPEIGGAPAVPALADLIFNADPQIAETAKSSLAGLSGAEADSTILQLLTRGSTAQRVVAMELVSRRRMSEAIPQLQQAASDSDANIRTAALKRLGDLAGLAEMPALLDLLAKSINPQDLAAIEEALGAVCARAADSDASATPLIARLATAKPAQKAALLRVLVIAGGGKALDAVRSAVKDSNPEIRSAAIDALSSWTTADAAPDLVALAKSSGSPAEKQLGLRGYLRWAADNEIPPRRRLEMCREVAGLVERPEEKRMFLAALGGINQAGSLSLILPFLDDKDIRAEACVAAVNVAEKMAQGRNAAKLAPELVAGLEKVAQVTTNAELAKRARAVVAANK